MQNISRKPVATQSPTDESARTTPALRGRTFPIEHNDGVAPGRDYTRFETISLADFRAFYQEKSTSLSPPILKSKSESEVPQLKTKVENAVLDVQPRGNLSPASKFENAEQSAYFQEKVVYADGLTKAFETFGIDSPLWSTSENELNKPNTNHRSSTSSPTTAESAQNSILNSVFEDNLASDLYRFRKERIMDAMKEKQWAEAAGYIKEILADLSPSNKQDDYDYWNLELGKMLIQQGKSAEALDVLKGVEPLSETRPYGKLCLLRAEACLTLGDLNTAKQYGLQGLKTMQGLKTRGELEAGAIFHYYNAAFVMAECSHRKNELGAVQFYIALVPKDMRYRMRPLGWSLLLTKKAKNDTVSTAATASSRGLDTTPPLSGGRTQEQTPPLQQKPQTGKDVQRPTPPPVPQRKVVATDPSAKSVEPDVKASLNAKVSSPSGKPKKVTFDSSVPTTPQLGKASTQKEKFQPSQPVYPPPTYRQGIRGYENNIKNAFVSACSEGDIGLIHILCTDKNLPDHPMFRFKRVFLHKAVTQNSGVAVSALLSFTRRIDPPDEQYNTPLHLAAALGHADIVSILLSAGANVFATTDKGFTPLHLAAFSGKEDACHVLLYYGPSAVNMKDKFGKTPEEVAYREGHKSLAKLLKL